jgi:hypothetical protein
MAKLRDSERLRAIHQEALQNFDRIEAAYHDVRQQCLQDRRFYSIAGAQWEGSLGDQFENKPKFEVNKIHLSVIRIINEWRNNRITVDYVSKDGTEDSNLANVCDGLFRADEQDSVAEEAYDNAFEEAVGGGYGAIRLRAEYEDEYDDDDERQRIRIEPIYDADSSVFFDLDAKRQDKSDARHCFVMTTMTPEAYEEEYGESPSSMEKSITEVEYDWFTPDVVFIAEYYRVEEKRHTVYIFKTLADEEERYTDEELEDANLVEELAASGSVEVRTKKVTQRKIHKYIISGSKVLEDCGYIAGTCIPIIPTYGKRWFVDNIERCMGHVRLAKDAQRLKNMQLSKLGEIAALSPIRKPIFTGEQVLGYQNLWARDNIDNNPYLLVNPITDKDGNSMPAGPIAYTEPPTIPQALAALLELTESDMTDLLGNQQAGDKMVSNISGKAVEMIQARLDMQSFIYMSNFAKAIKRVGEVWLSMARELYVEPGRKMKMIDKMEQIESVELMTPTMAEESGAMKYDNDISKATFDVAVSVGPSSTSRREATVRNLITMMGVTQDPETLQVLQAMVMLNMDGEGVEELKDYFRRKLVLVRAVEPNKEEAQLLQAQAQQKSAEERTLEAMANEADANATKARADVAKTISEIELNKAKTTETMADAESQAIENQIVAATGQKP